MTDSGNKGAVKSEGGSQPPSEDPSSQSDSLTSFLSDLKQISSRDQLSKLRLSRHSLFVPEEETERFIELFKKWLADHNAAAKSDEKCRRRLFGAESPKIWYLIEGKNCFTGYEVPCRLEPQKAQTLGIPLYQGSLQDPLNFLHPRDPVLSSTEGIEASLGNQGLNILVTKGNDRLRLPLPAVQRFAEVVRRSPLARRSGQPELSLRQALPLIVRLLRRAKPARRNRTTLIPAKFRNSRDAKFLALGSLTAVLDGDSVAGWYDLRGRNLVSFLIEELHEVIRTMPAKSIGPLRLPGEERGPLFVRSGEDRFRLALSALPGVIQAILRSRPQEGIENRVTFLDCLRRVAQMIEQSIWVPDYEVPKLFKKHLEEAPKVRKKDEWYFFIDKANTIRVCAGRGNIAPLPKTQEAARPRGVRGGPVRPGGRRQRHGHKGRPRRGGPGHGPPGAPRPSRFENRKK